MSETRERLAEAERAHAEARARAEARRRDRAARRKDAERRAAEITRELDRLDNLPPLRQRLSS